MTKVARSRSTLSGIVAVVIQAVAFAHTAVADEPYPSRAVRLIVPFPPGGPTDVIARLIGQSMTSRLGKSVLIETLAGAGGRIDSMNASSCNRRTQTGNLNLRECYTKLF